MKKSITILALAVISITNASASNLLKDSAYSAISKNEDAPGAKFISFADPSLIQSELGNLQKFPKTIDDIITADLQITAAVLPAKITLAKQVKKGQPVQLKKALQN